MANIPGMSNLPYCDPAIPMIFGGTDGRLITDDWGQEFKIEGNMRLAALAVLKYALHMKTICYGISFSRLEFDFRNGIKVKARCGESRNTPELAELISEINKLLTLLVYL